MTEHYPELLARVFFWRGGLAFALIANIFKMWLPRRTRKKLIFLGKGLFEKDERLLLEYIDSHQLFQEFGGTGPSLGGDEFIARGIERYEQNASRPSLALQGPVTYRSWCEVD